MFGVAKSCCLPSLHCLQGAATLAEKKARNPSSDASWFLEGNAQSLPACFRCCLCLPYLPTTPSANHCIHSKEQKGRGGKVACLLPLSDSNTVHVSETTAPSWKENQSPFLVSVGTQSKSRDRSQPSLLENKPWAFSIYTARRALTSTEIQLLKQKAKPLFYGTCLPEHTTLKATQDLQTWQDSFSVY